ncbi:metal ABC transporter permease [Candidimonas nitroreducens]|uniref:ABC transporter permease n=1 Tax=Candidimonas nitroreducens TaxID=683354 RepID=A0A225MZ23_9BURK|nr:metal ABC transporter permease [Candidimonas nitroreducens]OWT66364.1 ABC transporter permease [Candidimonas nitroreducens]
MLDYDFMRNAFAAGGVVALLSGVVGYFLVMRGQTFAGHALSHVGFAGATGAALLGLTPLGGLIGATLLGGIAMGLMGDRLQGSDVAIGAILALSLGLGMLFLHFYTSYATRATALLFGNVLGVGLDTVRALFAIAALCLVLLALIARPLVFASLQPELAAAKGVSTRWISVLFLAVVALATAQCIQIVGVLLVFTLMVGPGAAAQRLSSRLGFGVALSAGLAVAEAWLGIALAYYTDWPTSFWISALSAAGYLLAASMGRHTFFSFRHIDKL